MNGHVTMWIAAALVVIALTVLLQRATRGIATPTLVRRPILTEAEIAFHARLLRAVERISPDLLVFAQVPMAALIDTRNGMENRERWAARARFDRKMVDFAITDRRTAAVLLVELDDRTHDTAKDRARDAMTSSAGYRTMRIRGRDARNEEAIERLLRGHLIPS